MSLEIDYDYDPFRTPSEFCLAPPLYFSEWQGRQMIWRDLPEIERRILDIYLSGNCVLAHQLAQHYLERVYPSYEVKLTKSSKSNFSDSGLSRQQFIREFTDRMILEQNQVLYESGATKNVPPPLEPISATNFPTLFAWQNYCLENGIPLIPPETDSGSFKEFWKKYKTEIIIALVVIVIAVTIVVVIVTTQGAGAEIIVSTGTSAIGAVASSLNDDSEPEAPNVTLPPRNPQSKENLQNFANAIGGELKEANGITVVEISSFVENPNEFLNTALNKWQSDIPSVALNPFEVADIEKATEVPEPIIATPRITATSLSDSIPQTTPAAPKENQSPLPWQNESISYLQWRENQLHKELLDKLLNQTPTSAPPPSPAPTASTDTPLQIQTTQNTPTHSTITYVSSGETFTIQGPNLKNQHPLDLVRGTYATSRLTTSYPSQPFRDVPLIGDITQRTIHYHCGIGNGYEDILAGGQCLHSTLDRKFAIQPHLIHSHNLPKGLGFVLTEQFHKGYQVAQAILQDTQGIAKNPNWIGPPGYILTHSEIQKSIDYEAQTLSLMAQNIIAQENPKLKQVHVTFSNGGYVFNEALKKLTPEERDTIVVLTVGSTEIIGREAAHKVFNVVGSKDFGSQHCTGVLDGLEKEKTRAEIDLVPQLETQGIIQGHYFMQPQYQEWIATTLKEEVSGKYEIY